MFLLDLFRQDTTSTDPSRHQWSSLEAQSHSRAPNASTCPEKGHQMQVWEKCYLVTPNTPTLPPSKKREEVSGSHPKNINQIENLPQRFRVNVPKKKIYIYIYIYLSYHHLANLHIFPQITYPTPIIPPIITHHQPPTPGTQWWPPWRPVASTGDAWCGSRPREDCRRLAPPDPTPGGGADEASKPWDECVVGSIWMPTMKITVGCFANFKEKGNVGKYSIPHLIHGGGGWWWGGGGGGWLPLFHKNE